MASTHTPEEKARIAANIRAQYEEPFASIFGLPFCQHCKITQALFFCLIHRQSLCEWCADEHHNIGVCRYVPAWLMKVEA